MSDQSPISSSLPSTQWKSHVELTFTPQVEISPSKKVTSFKPIFQEKIEKNKEEPQIQHLSDKMDEIDQTFHMMMEIRKKLENAFQAIEKQLN